jgi:hypothetical protein
LDYNEAIHLFDARKLSSIKRHLLSAEPSVIVARELKSRIKLTSNLYELQYLLPILVKASQSNSLEVIEGAVHGLARFATERWQDYVAECLPCGAEEILIALLERKHKGIRSSAAQALMVTALQTGRLEVAHYPLRHASGKLRVSAIRSLVRCREAMVDITPLIPMLIELISRADKNEKKSIFHVLSDWIVESRPTGEHFRMLKIVQEQLEAKDHSQCVKLAHTISSFLDTHACGDDIDLLFEQLLSDVETERRTATQLMYPLFNMLVVLTEDVADKLTDALKHEDAQVREDIARMITGAEWRRGKPMSLLTHSDEAVRNGALVVHSIRNLSSQIIAPWIEKIDASVEKRQEQKSINSIMPVQVTSKKSAQASIVHASKEVGSLLSKFDFVGKDEEDDHQIEKYVQMIKAAIYVLPNSWKKQHSILAQWDKKQGSIYIDWYNLQEAGRALMLSDPIAFEWPSQQKQEPVVEPHIELKSTLKSEAISLCGAKLAFSGRFSRNKSDLETLATLALVDIQKSITQKCTILVVGQSPSINKLKKAKEQNVRVMSEQEFLSSLKISMPSMEVLTEFLWERHWDISYYGNESDGLCGSFCIPWPKGVTHTKSGLIQVARKDHLVKKYLDSGRENARKPELTMKALDKNQVDFGWIRAEKERDVRKNIVIKRWNKRREKPDRISANLLWEMLKYRIDKLDVLAVHSAREIESVIAVHLIGGCDHVTGELTGIILQRVWT